MRPRQSLQKIYQELSLPGFEDFWQQASAYLGGLKGYKKNTYTLTEEVRALINQRWRFFFERYDYPLLPPMTPGGSISFG